jgi:hypothetical protein
MTSGWDSREMSSTGNSEIKLIPQIIWDRVIHIRRCTDAQVWFSFHLISLGTSNSTVIIAGCTGFIDYNTL